MQRYLRILPTNLPAAQCQCNTQAEGVIRHFMRSGHGDQHHSPFNNAELENPERCSVFSF
jgi:hypothetical protein